MIRTLLVGVARCLFNLAAVTFALGLLLLYAAYRLLRAAVAKDGGQPVREAGFGTLAAIVGLAKALQAQAPRAPRERPVEHADYEDDLEEGVIFDGERSAA